MMIYLEVMQESDILVLGSLDSLSNNTIVHFKGDGSLIGQIVPVYLKECHGFYYLGEIRDESCAQ